MSLSLLMTVTIVIFLFVTLLLTAMLLFAKAKLTPKGLISIDINNGERIAQLVFAKVEQAQWTEVEILSDTARGEGGFGSTGVK